ncbi:AAA family ATPase [Terrabacter sp. 2TAF16]|uniref:helix-turn-helix transcriptional regulator n=1 Tax=Terrabacter sp. 2TAF16 TaxID=3233008 RepID=UPI003F95DBD1
MSDVRRGALVGRDGELSRLLELQSLATAGHGSTALVIGEAGVGKSRLVSEFAARTRDQGALVVTGHGVNLETGELPFAALADTLRDLVRQVGLDEVRRCLGPRAGELSGLVPALDSGGATWDRARILSAAATLLDGIAVDRPLCWIVEDLHWADSASRDLVAMVARSLADRSVMLVLTVRSDVASPHGLPASVADLQSLPESSTIWLARLDEACVRQQLDALGCVGLAPSVEERLFLLSEGLPLFVELLAANVDAMSDGLAPTLRQLVLARLPPLPGPSARVMEAAALGEVGLSYDLLARVAGIGDDELVAALTGAVEGGILAWVRDGRAVAFAHALIREAVAGSIPPPQRRELHRRWAAVLEPLARRDPGATFALAHHWYEAGESREALAASCRAAARASEMSEAALEAVHLRRCLDLWELVEDADAVAGRSRDEVLFELLSTRWATGDNSLVLETCDAELQRAEVQADSLSRLWMTLRRDRSLRVLGRTQDFGSVAAVSERAAVLLAAPPDIRTMDCLGENASLAERYAPDLATVQYQRSMAIAQTYPSRRARLYTRIFFGLDEVRHGFPDRAIDGLIGLREEFAGSPVADLWMIEGNLIHCLCDAGRYLDAIAVGGGAMGRVADPRSLRSLFGFVACNTAEAHLQLGQWAEADRLLTHAVGVRGRASVSIDGLKLVLGIRRGDIADQAPARREALHRADSRPDLSGTDESLADLIALLASVGDVAAMRDAVARLDEVHQQAMPSVVWPGLNAALRVEARQGSVHARSWVDRLDRQAARLRWSSPLSDAYRAEHAALMARFDGHETAVLWRRAVAAWVVVGRVWDEAHCRLRLAESLLAEGHRRDAQTESTEAFEIARRLGAAPLHEEIKGFARRARLPLPGDVRRQTDRADVLTARECEVLALVAEGRSNNEIASALFMSPKTASVHVSRILTKLQAANRTEAAAIARRHGLLD